MGAVVVVGSLNIDERLTVARLPLPGETVLGEAGGSALGGKGANQAAAAASTGVRTVMVGAVGDDHEGRSAAAALVDAGVEARLSVLPSVGTGRAVVAVDATGENLIVVLPGANALLDVAAVEREVVGVTGPGDVLVLQLETPLEVATAAAAGAGGALVVLNPSPVAALPDPLWEAVDVLVVNRAELAALADPSAGPEPADQMAGLPVRRVVTTLGAEGCLVRDGDTWHHVPAPSVEVVDTTGAGDCFCGVLAAGLARGETLVAAATVATHASALSVTTPGARPTPAASSAVDDAGA